MGGHGQGRLGLGLGLWDLMVSRGRGEMRTLLSFLLFIVSICCCFCLALLRSTVFAVMMNVLLVSQNDLLSPEGDIFSTLSLHPRPHANRENQTQCGKASGPCSNHNTLF
jgi:hypothetical protein